MKREPTAEMFLKDVEHHEMKVLLDSEPYRHIRFQQPRTSNLWFDLVTWPGVLTIHGDMGTWTFSRVEDMFEFFRSRKLEINPDYWAEKLRGGVYTSRDSAKVFEEELFKEHLLAQLSEYYSFEGEDLAELTAAVKSEVSREDGEWRLKIAAADFSHRFSDGETFHFDSCELPSGKEYAYHFIWCLYAIVWGIQQWDASPRNRTARCGILTD